MGGLGVCFAATRDVAVMHVLPPAVVSALAQLFSMDAVRAATRSLAAASGSGTALGLGAG